MLQEARAFQSSPAFADVRRSQQTAEHRLARLVQLGIRQARDVGRTKTLFQLAMAAAVANLTLLAAVDATYLLPVAAVALLTLLGVALTAVTASPSPALGRARPYVLQPVSGPSRSTGTTAFRPAF